jgi:hypothetical protein
MLAPLVIGSLLFQGPGDGWALVHDTRQVKRLYYDLMQTTEVWVRLIPESPDGKPPLVNLIFQAFYPGRAERDPYTGLPREPTGPPARLVVVAQPLPMTVIRELSLRLSIDDKTVDFTAPAARYRYLYPCFAGDGCSANGIEAELAPSLLRSMGMARVVAGDVLGFPVKLGTEDHRALREFADKVAVSGSMR